MAKEHYTKQIDINTWDKIIDWWQILSRKSRTTLTWLEYHLFEHQFMRACAAAEKFRAQLLLAELNDLIKKRKK